ncbi:MAG TPA: ABC transporter permease [Candidatus Spyradocola merdavium]|nr:ABC transporter permease [Candidatus Spyradocola merdavium]
MRKYILKRLLSMIPAVFVVSVVIFLIIHLTPGDPAAVMLGDQADPEAIAALREALGLNDPLPVQYLRWLGGVLQGDLGQSLYSDESMVSMLLSHLGPTLSLTVFALAISLIVAVPLGILAARKRGALADNAISVFSMIGISMPSFLLGLLLMLVFAVTLRWLPAAGYKTLAEDGMAEHLRYLVMPAIALGFMEAGLILRMTRSSMLEVLGSDYIRMAKAKGEKSLAITCKHAFKNALIPIVTTVGQTFMGLLSGATVVESIFNIPGIGKMTITAVQQRDYEVVQAVVLFLSMINIVVCLVIDLIYAAIDPRVRLSA